MSSPRYAVNRPNDFADSLPRDPRPPAIDWFAVVASLACAFVAGWYLCYLLCEFGPKHDHDQVVATAWADCPPGSTCPTPPSSAPAPFPGLVPIDGRPTPWETAVRITVVENGVTGVGSGTVVSGRADRALVMTCAHLFRPTKGAYVRPKQFRGVVQVETFALQARPALRMRQTGIYPAQVIDYDSARDVGLVTFAPGKPVPSSPIVAADWRPEVNDPMLSVGCSAGEIPTAWGHRLKGEIRSDDYHGLVVVPKPVEGRSGGGLFTLQSELAGVCNYAEIHSDRGGYAAPTSMRFILARNESELVASGDTPAPINPDQTNGRPRERVEPSPQAPPVSAPSFPPLPSVSWLERSIGISPAHLFTGGVAGLVAWLWSLRSRVALPQTQAQAPASTVGSTSTDSLWNQGLALLAQAARHDADQQAKTAAAADQAKLRAEVLNQLKAALLPTSGPSASVAPTG